MKRISAMNLIMDDKTFYCRDVVDVLELDHSEMVEVTISCTMHKKDYEKLMEEIK